MMPSARARTLSLCWVVFVVVTARLRAQIPVEGLADETVYADAVTFRVPAVAGYTYTTVELNGVPVAAGGFVDVNRPDYYELEVERRLDSSGAVESRLVQFIVRNTARGNSEWGLPSWVPLPPIDSAQAEFAGATLRIVAPAAFPQGLEVPVVAWVLDAAGERVGVNGTVRDASLPAFELRLLRGVGSAFIDAQASPGNRLFELSAGGLTSSRTVAFDASTTWMPATGTIGASASWGPDARIDVSGTLTIAAGATLTVLDGTVVRLGPAADIVVNGSLILSGTLERPVVFTPRDRGMPWGGIQLRTAASRLQASWAVLTGSGANPDWFGDNPGSGSSHRDEQPCIYLSNGARADLTDSFLVDHQGQAGHGEASFLTMTRCLVQRFITAGQYNGGTVRLNGCALVEFPALDAPFEDNDNDGLYLTGGAHFLTDTLVGWALDDGIDAGSGSAGTVDVTRCWFESTYHEGMAWSEDRTPTVRDTVATNCGQGLECGFGTPDVVAERCLSTANLIGARFGDNYDWDYDGSLQVTDSLLLFNHKRDVWGRAWDDWTEHLAQMDVRQNFLSAPNPSFSQNSLWQPATDAARLVPFLPVPAGMVGAGIATRADPVDAGDFPDGIPVRLSSFTTGTVSVDYVIEAGAAVLVSGTLTFPAGQTVRRVPLDSPPVAQRSLVRVRLTTATGAELTGRGQVDVVRVFTEVLIPTGAEWKYLSSAADQGTAWRALGFNDASWPMGPAELGFGDGDERTVLNGGPSSARYPTVYFRRRVQVPDPTVFSMLRLRLRRDDGAVVYLNGAEVFRSNLPAGAVTYATLAPEATDEEDTFFAQDVDPALLVAGENLVAVEVHQATATSSDLSFDFELSGETAPVSSSGFVRADANGDELLDISDAVTVLLYLFAGLGTDCEDALDADDSGALDISDAVYALEHLFRGGPAIPAPYPAAGDDPTADALGCERG
jgi:hypothetical protein